MWLKKNAYLINLDHVARIEPYLNALKMTVIYANPVGSRICRVEFSYANGEALECDYLKLIEAIKGEDDFIDLD